MGRICETIYGNYWTPSCASSMHNLPGGVVCQGRFTEPHDVMTVANKNLIAA